MEWLQRVPTWLFSVAFIAFVGLLGYLAISGVEFKYKDSFKFVAPGTIQINENTIEELSKRLSSLEAAAVSNPIASFPVGSIIPFYGELSSLTGTGWAICDGRDIPQGSSPLIQDANPTKGGDQLPDLRGRFIQGLDFGDQLFNASSALHIGGSDSLDLSHQHKWARYDDKNWYSFNNSGSEFLVTNWNNGTNSDKKGEYPLNRNNSDALNLYTNSSPLGSVENRPRYMKLHFIIRIR